MLETILKALTESIRSVCTKARKYGDRRLGEQNTKASLIEPLLEALGWDIRDPDEVHREFRPTGKDSPVDYALKLMRKPRLFLEAKGLGETLADRRWIAQVLGYATVAGVEWCVLSDGDEYRFYNASAPIDAEEKMFCRVRLTDGKDDEAVRALSLISRSNLEQNQLDVLWVSHFVDRRVKAALRELLITPTKSIVALVQQRAPKLTSKEVIESIRRLDIKIESPAVLPEVRNRKPSKASGPKGTTKPGSRSSPANFDVSLNDLIGAGLLRPPAQLVCRYRGQSLSAVIRADGQVEFGGTPYPTCSAAASAARGMVTGKPMATNGWDFWRVPSTDGVSRRLADVRDEFLKGRVATGPGQPPLRLTRGAQAS